MDEMEQILFEKEQTGINMSFILFIPKEINNKSILILNGITPSIGTEEAKNTKEYGTYNDSYKEALHVASNADFSPTFKKIAIDYNNPMLIPIIPRCNGLYTGFLGYDVYHENFDRAIESYNKGWSGFTKDDLEKFRGLDKQIADMIYYAVDYINKNYNLKLDYKVIATGYSASCKMANYFTALHPDLVKMVIAGGTGGLTIIPTTKYDYPLGFKDISENLELYKEIPQFYYIGDTDQNDPSRPEYERKKDKDGNVLFDENGNTIPEVENGQIKFLKNKEGKYILSDGGYYSLEQTHIIHPKYSDVQERFKRVRDIYKELEINNIIFKPYKGDHHFKAENLIIDINDFYERNINKRIILEDFILQQYDFDNENHTLLKDNLIKSTNSKLISKDINQSIINTKKCGKKDKISDVYVINYKNNLIGFAYVNYHPKEERDGKTLEEEIEIGLGLLDEYRGKHLGTLLEKELSKKLLSMYPNFNEIVARVEKDNLNSIKAVTNAGFVHVDGDEYHFKRL